MYFVLSSIFQSHCSWRNLHRWQKFYTASGSDGRDKSHICSGIYPIIVFRFVWTRVFLGIWKSRTMQYMQARGIIWNCPLWGWNILVSQISQNKSLQQWNMFGLLHSYFHFGVSKEKGKLFVLSLQLKQFAWQNFCTKSSIQNCKY